MKVQNKVIVVTGGGSGMGRALVIGLLSKGAKVAAVDINEDALRIVCLKGCEGKVAPPKGAAKQLYKPLMQHLGKPGNLAFILGKPSENHDLLFKTFKRCT
jgi:NAD(P)-dependent dehydrogenase (short-subunit alcohol dehydrogenase family)